MQRNERFDSADRIIKIGFWVNAILMVFKLAAGYWGHSEAVFADGIESACDFVAIFSTMVALKLGRKPFDEQHPYGHGRAENLSALLVSLVILATGAWILTNSIHSIIDRRFQSPEMIAVVAAFLTILIKEWLYRFTQKTGRELDSPSLLAIAKDHRKDAITSISTLAGVTGAYFGIGILDPLAAGLTAFLALHMGYQTVRDATPDLADGSARPDFIEKVTRLAESVERVEHVHDIRGRRTGQYMVIDLKLEMDPAMTVKESHDIANRVKKLIFEAFPNVGDVMIHVNPHDEEHEDLIRLLPRQHSPSTESSPNSCRPSADTPAASCTPRPGPARPPGFPWHFSMSSPLLPERSSCSNRADWRLSRPPAGWRAARAKRLGRRSAIRSVSTAASVRIHGSRWLPKGS